MAQFDPKVKCLKQQFEVERRDAKQKVQANGTQGHQFMAGLE